jgi:putative phosphoribosyl transferase
MCIVFADRAQAGAYLADRLSQYAHCPDVVVLGLPRGGVPVAAAIAHALDAPLDVMLVRKLGVPGQSELALGAIAIGGVTLINHEIASATGISHAEIDTIIAREQHELLRREKRYRGDRPPLAVQGRVVILVDDGLATGASMWAGVMALRKLNPARIVVAVPVASEEARDMLSRAVDEIVCGITPVPFIAVGAWYERFSQTTDNEVCDLLNHAAKPIAS